MINITAIGDVNVDLIAPIREIPGKGKQVLVEDLEVHGGGCATNFAFACSRLGAKSSLFGRVGDDIFGRYVLDLLKKEGVDVSGVKVSGNGKTGATIALVQGGERSFISYRGENARFSIGDIALERIEGDLVHLPSFFLLEGMQPYYPQLVNSIKTRVSFDTGWDPKGWKRNTMEKLRDILRGVDIFFPSLEEAKRIMGVKGRLSDEAQIRLARRYIDLGVEIIVLTIGEEGCLAMDGKEIVRMPAFEVEVVDTTGAGDVFNAGFVVSHLRGLGLKGCTEFASAAAAMSVTGKGWSRYPTFGEVEDFLSTHP
jgi:ribokinase